MTEKKCGNCEAFCPSVAPSQVAQCRRHAPQVVVNRYITGQDIGPNGAIVQVLSGYVDGYFPPTNLNMFCLDFIHKAEPVMSAPAVEVDLESDEVKTLPIAGLVDPAITH